MNNIMEVKRVVGRDEFITQINSTIDSSVTVSNMYKFLVKNDEVVHHCAKFIVCALGSVEYLCILHNSTMSVFEISTKRSRSCAEVRIFSMFNLAKCEAKELPNLIKDITGCLVNSLEDSESYATGLVYSLNIARLLVEMFYNTDSKNIVVKQLQESVYFVSKFNRVSVFGEASELMQVFDFDVNKNVSSVSELLSSVIIVGVFKLIRANSSLDLLKKELGTLTQLKLPLLSFMPYMEERTVVLGSNFIQALEYYYCSIRNWGINCKYTAKHTKSNKTDSNTDSTGAGNTAIGAIDFNTAVKNSILSSSANKSEVAGCVAVPVSRRIITKDRLIDFYDTITKFGGMLCCTTDNGEEDILVEASKGTYYILAK